MRLLNFFTASLIFVNSMPLMASNMYIRPRASTTSDIFFADSTSSTDISNMAFAVKATVSCYGTNLRSVSNPLSPTASVQMAIQLSNGTGLSVIFPGILVKSTKDETGTFGPSLLTFLNGTPNAFPARAVRNTIIFNVPSSAGKLANFDYDGHPDRYDVSQRSKLIQNIHFKQDLRSLNGGLPNFAVIKDVEDWGVQKALKNVMRPFRWISEVKSSYAGGGDGDGDGDGDGGDGGGTNQFIKLNNNNDIGWGQGIFGDRHLRESEKYMGKDGALTGNWEATWSSDFKTLNINASFPGQNGFCGGYFSPLMLYFDNQRPEYTEKVNFKMNSYSDSTYWPESTGHNGYFLALDRNGDGIINDISELFGSEDSSTNGFEILRLFDSNGDGKIDKNDPIFDQLVLWKDSTGKAETLKKDLKKLRDLGVTEISLDYSSGPVKSIGSRAEERERAAFNFKKSGKMMKGEVIDVWFATY